MINQLISFRSTASHRDWPRSLQTARFSSWSQTHPHRCLPIGSLCRWNEITKFVECIVRGGGGTARRTNTCGDAEIQCSTSTPKTLCCSVNLTNERRKETIEKRSVSDAIYARMCRSVRYSYELKLLRRYSFLSRRPLNFRIALESIILGQSSGVEGQLICRLERWAILLEYAFSSLSKVSTVNIHLMYQRRMFQQRKKIFHI